MKKERDRATMKYRVSIILSSTIRNCYFAKEKSYSS